MGQFLSVHVRNGRNTVLNVMLTYYDIAHHSL